MIKLLLLIVCLYMGAVFYLYFTQDSKIFNFSIVKKQKPQVLTICSDCQEVKLKSDGALLDGVYKENNSTKLIIYFGGNSDDATDFIKYCKDLKDFDILAFNYRGNALSSGKPTQNAIFKDALKIYDTFAKDREVYLVGRSLGSGVATYLASKRESKKLLLITPYDSIEAVAKEKYPYFPISLLIKYKFNSLHFIKDIKIPVTIFMVDKDATVSNKRTDNLISHIKNLSNVVIFKDTTHADILDTAQFSKELKKWAKM